MVWVSYLAKLEQKRPQNPPWQWHTSSNMVTPTLGKPYLLIVPLLLGAIFFQTSTEFKVLQFCFGIGFCYIVESCFELVILWPLSHECWGQRQALAHWTLGNIFSKWWLNYIIEIDTVFHWSWEEKNYFRSPYLTTVGLLFKVWLGRPGETFETYVGYIWDEEGDPSVPWLVVVFSTTYG